MSTRFVTRPGAGKPAEGPWPGAYRGGICPDCRAEVRDPRSRHFRDPFHDCRECGPGAAITRRFPFVRENTTYAEFAPCEACAREAASEGRQCGSPSTSCPECGPQYWIEPAPPLGAQGDVLYEAAQLLKQGRILAIKDQRAFRLIARADDDRLVQKLQRRQEWKGTPVGLMVRDVAMARRVAHLTEDDEAQLLAVSSPRVVLPLREDAPLAGRLRELGEVEVMLPTEAVYEILFSDLAPDADVPLLAIPAQVGVDAPVRENEEARRILQDVADALVLHDLVLFPCTEDWVLRVVDHEPIVIRRSGADTDCPLPVPDGSPQVLGLGCGSEATAAASFRNCIRLGPFVGELDSDRSIDQFGRTARRLVKLFDGHPAFVALDTTTAGRFDALLDDLDATPVRIDHHHAHVAAVMAEHGILGPVAGLSLDGAAPVVDPARGRTVVLAGDAADTRELDAFPAFRIPAASLATRDAWRSTLGLVHDLAGAGAAREWASGLGDSRGSAESALTMLRHGVDCTRVESFGRTLCALTDLVRPWSPPGLRNCALGRLAGPVRDLESGSLPARDLPLDALLAGIVVEVTRRGREKRPVSDTAAWALTALSRGLGLWAARLARREGLDTVVAGGGGTAEPWVRHVLARTLREEGLELYMSQRMPCGDAGIALGQVWSVMARQT